MRGQRLFIRPIEPDDREAIRRFLELHRNARAAPPPACGLLGKLVGELVAILEMEIAGDSILLTDLVIATELRRKRIGRAMVEELARMAEKMELSEIVVPDPREADRFLQKVGFTPAKEGLVRRVPRS